MKKYNYLQECVCVSERDSNSILGAIPATSSGFVF